MKILSLITALLCPGLSAQAQEPGPIPAAPPPAANLLRIGAWNIENLGTRTAGPQKIPAPQKPAHLAAYITAAAVDVLCLEEIHDDDQQADKDPVAPPYRNKILDETLPLLKAKTGDDWRYELTDPIPENDRCQAIGVLWRTSRAELKGRWKPPVAGGKHPPGLVEVYWKRRPEAFHFKALNGKADFVLVPLHMKSNEGTEGTDMRPVEARQFRDCLPGLADHFKGEKDIVLLGDTNINPGEHAVQDIWNSFTDLNATERNTWNVPGSIYPPAPFDRIFVPKGQPEFANAKQTIHGPYPQGSQTKDQWFTEHEKFRSDHLLVWCDIEVAADDD